MKLVLRTIETGEMAGRGLILCDENDVPLPGQTALGLQHNAEGESEVTISFFVDGDLVKIG